MDIAKLSYSDVFCVFQAELYFWFLAWWEMPAGFSSLNGFTFGVSYLILMEWLRQNDDNFGKEMKEYLFAEEKDISKLEKK